MKTYKFSGYGNFSGSFGWDNGLSSSLGAEIDSSDAVASEESAADYSSMMVVDLPLSQEKGLYYCSNEHGGSRNVEGYVIAESKESAIKMLAEFDNTWTVIEYEAD